jgi:xylan 1,4-beta-xylosidase
MPEQRVAVERDGAAALDDIVKTGVREKPDVSALAASGKGKLCVMVWHYHDDDVAGPDAAVDLTLDGLPQNLRQTRVQHFRIDTDHSNAFTVWKKMNSPLKPTAEQFAQLEKAGQLAELEAPKNVPVEKGEIHFHMVLPRQAVSLLVFDYSPAP